MKNTLKFLGIIAFVAVIGFTMTACGEENPCSSHGVDTTTVSVTGFSEHSGKMSMIVYRKNNAYEAWGMTNNVPVSGAISFNTYCWECNEFCTLAGSYTVNILFFVSQEALSANDYYEYAVAGKDISQNTTMSKSEFQQLFP